MTKKTPQEYANELLQMYRENARALDEGPSASLSKNNVITSTFEDGTGGLQINVTTLGRLYPVKGALVTVFTGDAQNRTVIETSITDKSGQTNVFNLKTPPAAESQQAENGGANPYANYNVSVRNDGYVEQIAMSVPVFSGVLSVQGFDLLPLSAAGKNTSPQIINEDNNYNL